MIQTLTSLSSHGYAPAHTRQILHVRSWLPLANNCSSKFPNKYLTAITQTLANTQQSSSHLANYCPIKIDDVLLTTYLAASHVQACTPMATIKNPSNSRQTTLQRHHNVMPTTARRTVSTPMATIKNPSNSRQTTLQRHHNVMPTTARRTVSTPKTTAKNLVNILYAAVLQLPNTLQTDRKHPKSDRQTPRQRPVCSCVTAALLPTNRPQTTLCEPSAILSVTCNSLAIHLPYYCPTIA